MHVGISSTVLSGRRSSMQTSTESIQTQQLIPKEKAVKMSKASLDRPCLLIFLSPKNLDLIKYVTFPFTSEHGGHV